MKKISNGAGVLIIAVAMILSGIAVTANTKEQTIGVNCSIGSGSAPGTLGPIVWDNSMEFSGLAAAQKDDNYPFYAEFADDFHFEEDTEVADVHWVGGYWNDPNTYNQVHWPWEITFWNDRGDGEAPGDVFAGPFVFDNTQYSEELIQDTGTSIYYTFGVNLEQSVIFPACTKFWITIRGVGFFPPQSGVGSHGTILLWEGVFRCELLGYPDWTDSTIVFGAAADMAFQLTGPIGPAAPTPPDIDGPGEGPADTEICWTFHSSDENGDMVKYYIDWGDGTTDTTDYEEQCTPVEVCHTYAKGTYTITAYAEDETGLQSGSSSFDVTIPRARSAYHPFVFRLFERFPSVFPILRQLLGL